MKQMVSIHHITCSSLGIIPAVPFACTLIKCPQRSKDTDVFMQNGVSLMCRCCKAAGVIFPYHKLVGRKNKANKNGMAVWENFPYTKCMKFRCFRFPPALVWGNLSPKTQLRWSCRARLTQSLKRCLAQWQHTVDASEIRLTHQLRKR